MNAVEILDALSVPKIEQRLVEVDAERKALLTLLRAARAKESTVSPTTQLVAPRNKGAKS